MTSPGAIYRVISRPGVSPMSFSVSMRSASVPGVFTMYTTENGFAITRSTVPGTGFSVPSSEK